jgi:VIT1/CCC1 family predicted Fe2+/Mn2+ transporter
VVRASAHPHAERHATSRIGWLRAAVLGANDGIVSTTSLLLGVAAAEASRQLLFTTGVAALVAGALSMAVGEFVSVSSQRDSERADIAKERRELARFPEHELDELTEIYIGKGLTPELARAVAVELHNGDPLEAHMVEELGITKATMARPMQAAWSSAASFAVGAAIPVIAVVALPDGARIGLTAVVALFALAALGILGARTGGADPVRPTVRTVLGGAAAMAITTVIGRLVGGAVG